MEPVQTLSMTAVARPAAKADTVLISIGDAVRPVSWRQIVWLAADGNYVRIFTREKDYFYHRSLGGLLAELGEDRFIRIHRSWAVNIAEIAGVRPLKRGDAELHLRNGQKLRMSARFRHHVSHCASQMFPPKRSRAAKRTSSGQPGKTRGASP